MIEPWWRDDEFCDHVEPWWRGDGFCDHVKNLISLISYGDYNLKTTYKPELLNNFFDNKLDMEWHPNVIKDYNGKSLYLTSKN